MQHGAQAGCDARGYVTDIPYTHAVHPLMAPPALALALAHAGVRPPRFDGPFTYCDLGFGQGVTLALLAAAWPGARFHGTDINPDHAAFCRSLGDRAGLGNLSVAALDFAAYGATDLPDMDVIALHGVWSWVGAEARAALLDFIGRRLKPGGVVYLAYNALPGWTQDLTLRRLLKAAADRHGGPLAAAIPAALDQVSRLAAAGSRYFAANPAAAARLEDLRTRPLGYLAHEFFNRDWTPWHFADVAADMARIGLRFAARADIADQLDDAALPADGLALLAEGTDDPVWQEGLRDAITCPPVRRDLFVRDPQPLDPDGRMRHLAAQPFIATGEARRIPGTATLPQGSFALARDRLMTVAEAIASGPANADGLAARLDMPAASVVEALVQLSALGFAAPVGEGAGDAGAGCARFNALVLEAALSGDTLSTLASPVTGAGVEVDRIERLFLLARQRGEDPVAFAWSVLSSRGEGVSRDGRVLRGEAENRAELSDRLATFTRCRLPVLAALGVAG